MVQNRKGGESVPGKAGNINRDRQVNYSMITYQLLRSMITLLSDGVIECLNIMYESSQCSSKLRPLFSSKMGCCWCARLQCFAKNNSSNAPTCYILPPDALDENLCISKTVANDSLFKFAAAEVKTFGSEYLRAPNEEDIACILAVNKV